MNFQVKYPSKIFKKNSFNDLIKLSLVEYYSDLYNMYPDSRHVSDTHIINLYLYINEFGLIFLNSNIHSFETGEKRKFGLYLPSALLVYASSVTAAYLYINNPVFHQISYALLVSILNFRSYYLLTQIPKGPTQMCMKKLLFTAWTTFGLGFFLWNIDNITCHQLRQARHKIGMPLSHLLELHGWWHIGTAFGTYYWVVFSSYIRVVLLHKDNEYHIKWKLGFVPYVAKINNISKKEIKLSDTSKKEIKLSNTSKKEIKLSNTSKKEIKLSSKVE